MHVDIHLANNNYQLALETADHYLNSLNLHQVKILVPDLLNQKARALIGLKQVEQAYQTLIEARLLATEQNSRRSLWAILLDMADLENDPQTANVLRDEARQIITYISTHISDPDLSELFLNLARVRRSD